MLQVILLFFLFQFGKPTRECDGSVDCSEVELVAARVGKLLVAQSSIDNDNVDENVEKLKKLMGSGFTAKLCGHQNADFDTFFTYLALDRRRIKRNDGHVVPVVRSYTNTQFTVEYRLTDKMNFTTLEIFMFRIRLYERVNGFNFPYTVVHVQNVGACVGFEQTDKDLINQYEEKHYEKSEFAMSFATKFPFTDYIENIKQATQEMFKYNFEAIIDKSGEYSYNLGQWMTSGYSEYAHSLKMQKEKFMVFMDDFNALYLNNTHHTPTTTILSQKADHIVFRIDPTFKYLDRTEKWMIQVEAICPHGIELCVNFYATGLWKISKLYMRPPFETLANKPDDGNLPLIREIAEILITQSSVDNEKAEESLEKLRAMMFTGGYKISLCHGHNADFDQFVIAMKLNRRRILETRKQRPEFIMNPKIHYINSESYAIHIPVVNRMGYKSEDIYQIDLYQPMLHFFNKDWFITKITIRGECEGFYKIPTLFDLLFGPVFMNVHNEESLEFVRNFNTLLPFTKYIENPNTVSELFYENFEAMIDTTQSMTYNTSQFMEYMFNFNQFHTYKDKNGTEHRPTTLVYHKNKHHIIFRIEAVFKVLNHHEVWLFQFDIKYDQDGDKKWKVSQLYMRPPFELYAKGLNHFRTVAQQGLQNALIDEFRNMTTWKVLLNKNFFRHMNVKNISVCDPITDDKSNLTNGYLLQFPHMSKGGPPLPVVYKNSLEIDDKNDKVEFSLFLRFSHNAICYAYIVKVKAEYNERNAAYYPYQFTIESDDTSYDGMCFVPNFGPFFSAMVASVKDQIMHEDIYDTSLIY